MIRIYRLIYYLGFIVQQRNFNALSCGESALRNSSKRAIVLSASQFRLEKYPETRYERANK